MKYIIIILTLLLFSCKKEKPKTGNYISSFQLDNGDYITSSYLFEITKSTKEELIINGISFQKDKNKIKGTFPKINTEQSYVYPFEIEGEWSKKKGRYTLNGTFKTQRRFKTSTAGYELIDMYGVLIATPTF